LIVFFQGTTAESLKMRPFLGIALLLLLAAEPAAAWCGHDRLPPRGGRIGAAPLALGDSVMQGAARPLARAGLEVDARCGRSPRGGLHVLRKRLRRGTLPQIVVVGLGTNVYMSSGDIRRTMRTLGRGRRLLLVTPVRSRRAFGNGPMRRAARRWPRRVRLVDWSRHALPRRHLIGGDGTHLTPAGVRAYTRLIKRAAWSRQRGRFGR
jgi:hypothetical protein